MLGDAWVQAKLNKLLNTSPSRSCGRMLSATVPAHLIPAQHLARVVHNPRWYWKSCLHQKNLDGPELVHETIYRFLHCTMGHRVMRRRALQHRLVLFLTLHFTTCTRAISSSSAPLPCIPSRQCPQSASCQCHLTHDAASDSFGISVFDFPCSAFVCLFLNRMAE